MDYEIGWEYGVYMVNHDYGSLQYYDNNGYNGKIDALLFSAVYGIDAFILASEWEHIWRLDRLVVNLNTKSNTCITKYVWRLDRLVVI